MTVYGEEELTRKLREKSSSGASAQTSPIERFVLVQAKRYARQIIKAYLRSKKPGKMTDVMRWKQLNFMKEEVTVDHCTTVDEVHEVLKGFDGADEWNQQLGKWYADAQARLPKYLEKQEEEEYFSDLGKDGGPSEADIIEEVKKGMQTRRNRNRFKSIKV